MRPTAASGVPQLRSRRTQRHDRRRERDDQEGAARVEPGPRRNGCRRGAAGASDGASTVGASAGAPGHLGRQAADGARVALRERGLERRVELGIAVGASPWTAPCGASSSRSATRSARRGSTQSGCSATQAAQPRERLLDVASPSARRAAVSPRPGSPAEPVERWTLAEQRGELLGEGGRAGVACRRVLASALSSTARSRGASSPKASSASGAGSRSRSCRGSR